MFFDQSPCLSQQYCAGIPIILIMGLIGLLEQVFDMCLAHIPQQVFGLVSGHRATPSTLRHEAIH
jgi:hypothetical protein